MTTSTRMVHLELDDEDGAGPIEGSVVILVADDAVSPAAANAGAGLARRKARIAIPRAAVATMLASARRIDADAALDALPQVVAKQ